MPWPLSRGCRRLGERTLKLGCRGEDVAELQQKLSELGYHPGPVDGIYGYLTEEAVRGLQKDYRLRVDGKAGKRVFLLLNDEALTSMRTMLSVQGGDSLRKIAARYHTSAEVLRRSNPLARVRRLYPGQQLVILNRAVMAHLRTPGAADAANRTVVQQRQHLTGLTLGSWRLTRDGRVEDGAPADVPWQELAALGLQLWPAVHNWQGDQPGTGYDLEALQKLLRRGRAIRRAVDAMVELARQPAVAGIYLDLGEVRWGEGPRFHRLAALLAQGLQRAGRRLLLGLPLRNLASPWVRLANDLDYGALARLAHRVVLRPVWPAEDVERGGPPLAGVEKRLLRLLRLVPAWKCQLGLPVGALDAALAGAADQRRLSYQRALTLAYLHRHKPRWDPQALCMTFRYQVDEVSHVVWVETARSLGLRMDLVDQFSLAGVHLWSLGQEDARLWQAIRQRFRVHKPA